MNPATPEISDEMLDMITANGLAWLVSSARANGVSDQYAAALYLAACAMRNGTETRSGFTSGGVRVNVMATFDR